MKTASNRLTRLDCRRPFWLVAATAAALSCAAEPPGTPPGDRPIDAGLSADSATAAPAPGGPDGSAGTGSGAVGTAGRDDAAAPPAPTPDASPAPGGPRGPVGNPNLDDLEDCDGAILPNDSRTGSWYRYLDTFGSTLSPAMFKPEAGGSPVSPTCSVHVQGMSINDPAMMKYGYAGIGFSFTDSQPFDASGYDGVSFWAKGTGQIRVAVTIPAITAVMHGGTCTSNCDDSYGFVVGVTEEWKKFEVPWSVLRQAGWGTIAPFEQTKVTGVDFGFGSGSTFDVRIDDVAFFLPP